MTDFLPLVCPYCKLTDLRLETRTEGTGRAAHEVPDFVQCMTPYCPGEWNPDGTYAPGHYSPAHHERWSVLQGAVAAISSRPHPDSQEAP